MNISIIGSCQSRDIFNSKFIEGYKKHFQVYSYFSMTSMLSVMSEPITYAFHRLMRSGFKDCLMEHWYQEFEKNHLKILESKQPDVLLMDFYGDARYGAISYGSEYVINRVDKLLDKDIVDAQRFGIVYSYTENTEDFIIMWKNAFDRFMAFMQEKLPGTEIIINTIKGTNIVRDSKGNEYLSPNIKDLDVDRINALWERFDNYAIEKYKLKAIRYDKEYRLDPEYPFSGLGWALVHYHKDYYEDCFNSLLKFVEGNKRVVQKDVNVNLMRDTVFKNKLSDWSNMAGKYDLIEYSDYKAIRVRDCREELGKYRPQVWSRPIEIVGDGSKYYTLSFNLKVEDLSLLEEDEVVFAIRTFKQVGQSKSGESIEEHALTIKDYKINDNEECRCVFTFKPAGKYLRLGPFMFRYVPGVEYSKIKLECSAVASDYTK